MKKTTLLATVSICSLTAFAQTIPNAGFETWINNNESPQTYLMPQNWLSIDVLNTVFVNDSSYVINSVSQVGNAHSGSYAADMHVGASTFGDTIGGAVYSVNSFADLLPLINGTGMSGFPLNTRPANLTGYYKLNTAGGTRVGICDFLLTRWNGQTRDTLMINSNPILFTNDAATWTSFTIPLTYNLPVNPDTMIMVFGLDYTSQYWGNLNGSFTVDDIAFTGNVPIGINEPNAFVPTASVFPNPTNENATISLNGHQMKNASFEVYDIAGQLVSSENNLTGTMIQFSREGLAAGTYSFRIVENGEVISQGKMILTE
jgi:Secretion system C-terminal sorting domain